MTRWDCDVKLWRGVPCSFPAFHGWTVSAFRYGNVVLSSTATVRYVWCGACKWVPYCSRGHECTVTPVPQRQEFKIATASDSASVPEEVASMEECMYVIATEKFSDIYTCSLCTQRMRLEFLQEIEEWVYMDCVEHEGVPIHKLCRDCVYNL